MKKIVLIFFAVTYCLWHFDTLAMSDTTDITLQAEAPDKNKEPEKGHRIPAAPFICTIDFDNHRIVTT
ncbi:MAG: hypothetical protein K2L11_08635, partial [Muribaculaceae bacterium]|nr:hypothetical protein [Muribaculaceae bacterium]